MTYNTTHIRRSFLYIFEQTSQFCYNKVLLLPYDTHYRHHITRWLTSNVWLIFYFLFLSLAVSRSSLPYTKLKDVLYIHLLNLFQVIEAVTNAEMLLLLFAFSTFHSTYGDSVMVAPIPVLTGSISVSCVPAETRSNVGLGVECDLQRNDTVGGRYCRGVLLGEHVSPALCYCADQPGNGSTLTSMQAAHLYLRMSKTFNKSACKCNDVWNRFSTRYLLPCVYRLIKLNSSWPSYACMRQWPRSWLLQIMVCRLFGAKPLSQPLVTYC